MVNRIEKPEKKVRENRTCWELMRKYEEGLRLSSAAGREREGDDVRERRGSWIWGLDKRRGREKCKLK